MAHLRGGAGDTRNGALIAAVHQQQGQQQRRAGRQDRCTVRAQVPLNLHSHVYNQDVRPALSKRCLHAQQVRLSPRSSGLQDGMLPGGWKAKAR